MFCLPYIPKWYFTNQFKTLTNTILFRDTLSKLPVPEFYLGGYEFGGGGGGRGSSSLTQMLREAHLLEETDEGK